MIRLMATAAFSAAAFFSLLISAADAQDMPAAYQALVTRHAAANGLPASLVHRVIMRESRYNPRAVSKGNYGMMQIRLGTARAMGYAGGTDGLLDAETNLTYAVRYLAGAYRAAGGNHDRAVTLYARGFYPEAKAMGFSPYAQTSTPANAGAAFASAGRAAAPAQMADAAPAQSRTGGRELPAN